VAELRRGCGAKAPSGGEEDECSTLLPGPLLSISRIVAVAASALLAVSLVALVAVRTTKARKITVDNVI
jgi:hypothetical protein